MMRVGFILKVKKNMIEEYKRRHQNVWPDMQKALRETGWHNYSLFLRDDGMLFGYLETPDFDAARAAMATKEVNARWQSQMGEFFEQLDGQMPDEGMVPLEEVFHLD
jgi:L-rhamnose mutarotase